MPEVSKKRKSVACQRCHKQKIKCNGAQPCHTCVQSRHDCNYPERDRKVTVNESLIKRLMAENEELKRSTSGTPQPSSSSPIPIPSQPQPAANDEHGVQNLLVGEQARFSKYDGNLWVYMCEAACTTFSSRLCQELSGAQAQVDLIRQAYVQESQLNHAYNSDNFSWPTRPQAFMLVETALRTVGKCYHISRYSTARKSLEMAYKDVNSVDQLTISKLLAMFALGEVYSPRRSADPQGVPGLVYFAQAKKLLRIIPERPCIEHIEISIMFAIYSLSMNRRYSAYRHIGTAMRQSIVSGLHQKIRGSQLPDLGLQKYRKVLFWSVYILDRQIASKSGYPSSLQSDEIEVEFPTDDGLSEAEREDFVSSEYLTSSIKLAKLTGVTIRHVYSRVKSPIPFTQRVQNVFKELTEWFETLPAPLQLQRESACNQVAHHVTLLHLAFNQCVILATRPMLLHVFRALKGRRSATASSIRPAVPRATQALAETCIHTARHSYRLLTRSWISGTLASLDFFSAHYTFAAGMVLLLSSLAFPDNQSDRDDFDSAALLLKELENKGNFAGREYYHHLELLLSSTATFETDTAKPQAETQSMISMESGVHGPEPFLQRNNGFGEATTQNEPITTEMAIFGAPIQDFLMQGDIPLFPDDGTLDGFDWLNMNMMTPASLG